MSKFNNELKGLTKKISAHQGKPEDVGTVIELSNGKVSEFQLYSLALKYYSYLERNLDFEDDFEDEVDAVYKDDVHVHDETCDHSHEEHDLEEEGHDHHHEHHNHDKIICNSLEELKETFEAYVYHFAKDGTLPTINQLLELREELKKHVTVLTAYGDQISLLENVYFKSRYSEENMNPLDTDESFSQRVTEFLMSNDNSAEIREHLKVIYPELPMRMTKGKFFSYIDVYFNRLQGISGDDVKNHIQLLKETFDPTSVEDYGSIASEINDELKKVKDVIINGNAGEKDSAYHHMYHLTEDKNDILEQALDISELLNHVLSLALMEFNADDSKVYKVTKPLLLGERNEELLAGIFEDVEMNYEPLGDDLIKVGSAIDLLSEVDESVIGDHAFALNELKYAYELSKEGYFIERPASKNDDPLATSELALIKNELVGFMKEVLSGESRAMKRGRMSLMMGIFQIVHTNGQEIYDHIYHSIHACDIKGEKVMSMQNIYSYINDFID